MKSNEDVDSTCKAETRLTKRSWR